MNERIQELAKGAKHAFEQEGILLELVLEKYAELIVRECIQVCNSRVGNSDYNTGRMHCVSDLKEHFGVEDES